MRKYKISILVPVLIFTAFSSCKIDDEYLSKHQWKYYDGAWIGDWLEFNNNYYAIRNDTIFINDTARAIIEKVENRIIADNLLHIKKIDDQQNGRYSSK